MRTFKEQEEASTIVQKGDANAGLFASQTDRKKHFYGLFKLKIINSWL